MQNVNKLKNMNPKDFIQKLQNCNFVANEALKETKNIIGQKKYETLNPQMQVLANKIFFKEMLDKYLEFLDRKLKDSQLQTLSNKTNDFPKISTEEYKKMPKRYRGIFVPFDKKHYVLHSQDEARPVVSTKKFDTQKLEALLDFARILIMTSESYGTKWQPNLKTSPKFAKHLLSPHFVSNNQIDIINKLRDTFIQIDEITDIYVKEILVNKYDNMTRHGAIDVYMEYQNELTNKNRYTDAQNAINITVSEYTGLQYLAEQTNEQDRYGILVLAQYAKQSAEAKKKEIIANMLKNRTR